MIESRRIGDDWKWGFLPHIKQNGNSGNLRLQFPKHSTQFSLPFGAVTDSQKSMLSREYMGINTQWSLLLIPMSCVHQKHLYRFEILLFFHYYYYLYFSISLDSKFNVE